jgi:hypothetical protein
MFFTEDRGRIEGEGNEKVESSARPFPLVVIVGRTVPVSICGFPQKYLGEPVGDVVIPIRGRTLPAPISPADLHGIFQKFLLGDLHCFRLLMEAIRSKRFVYRGETVSLIESKPELIVHGKIKGFIQSSKFIHQLFEEEDRGLWNTLKSLSYLDQLPPVSLGAGMEHPRWISLLIDEGAQAHDQ